MTTEGGFQGRTNKLVDGCYSFWQGGVFPLLDQAYVSKTRSVDAIVASEVSGWMFDEDALQKYILVCCQDAGGLRDKPGKYANI
jgi:protein farnesyltransferase subunit beta